MTNVLSKIYNASSLSQLAEIKNAITEGDVDTAYKMLVGVIHQHICATDAGLFPTEQFLDTLGELVDIIRDAGKEI